MFHVKHFPGTRKIRALKNHNTPKNFYARCFLLENLDFLIENNPSANFLEHHKKQVTKNFSSLVQNI